jgi:DNA-directed RNA polymerase subunit RPC12/RpoP
MPDREKVLKGLECLITDEVPCEGCLYNGSGYCLKNIAKDARELLKEQEPVEPTANDEAIRVTYNCGECGYLVGFVSTIHNDMQYRAKYCPECGRKVLWHG